METGLRLRILWPRSADTKNLDEFIPEYWLMLGVLAMIVNQQANANAVNFLTEASNYFSAWCFCQLLALCSHWPRQIIFYEWFVDCGLSESKRRGLATYGYAVFGCIPVPNITTNQLRVVAYLYGGVLLAGVWTPTTSFLHFAGLMLSILYHGSLWAERASSHHREILTITLWMYSCLAPDLSHATAAFRIHICSIYIMSVVQKTVTSIIRGQSWSRWSLHGFLWKSMWAKTNFPAFPALQRFIFVHPSVAHLGGWISMVCELGPLLSLFFPVQHLAYLALVGMHFAVLFLQGIDYVSYWTPSLLVGIFCSSNTLELACAWCSVRFVPMLLLLGAQLLFALTMAENFNINIPPLMSCPMFVTVARLDDTCHQHYVMTVDGELPYERIEWMYPFVKPEYGMGLLPSDVAHFPMPFVAFGWGGNLDGAPGIFHRWFLDVKGFYLMTNVSNFPKDLRLELEAIVTELHGRDASNPCSLYSAYSPYSHLWSLADRCKNARSAFARHVTLRRQQKWNSRGKSERHVIGGPVVRYSRKNGRKGRYPIQFRQSKHCKYKPQKNQMLPRYGRTSVRYGRG